MKYDALKFASALAIGTALCLSSQAFAQKTAADRAETSGLDEIVVTAQKRSENIQDVPISISAFNEQALTDRGITNLAALDGMAANVRFTKTTGFGNQLMISIRGQTLSNPAGYFEAPVGLYVDGVFVPKLYGLNFDLPNIERIEVLKGPQGTLYGRNTIAGAVNVITKKPSGEAAGQVEVGYGSYDNKIAKFYIDTPAIGPLSMSFTGMIETRDGYFDIPVATAPGTFRSQNSELSRINHKAFQYAARLKPSDRLTIDYSFAYINARDTPSAPKLTDFARGANNPIAIFDPNSASYSGVPLYLYLQPSKYTKDVLVNGGFGHVGGQTHGNEIYENTHTYANTVTAAYDLGNAELKSITAWRKLYYESSTDFDGTPIPFLSTGLDVHDSSFSQELNLAGQADRLKYIVGLYYFNEEGRTESDLDLDQSFRGIGVLRTISRWGFGTKSYAAFAQLDWTPPVFGDRVTLTGGLRYNSEKRTGSRFTETFIRGANDFVNNTTNQGPVSLGRPFGAGTNVSKKFNAVTPTATIRYAINDDVNVFFRYARGFKSGGWQGEATTLAEYLKPFDPVKTDSFEIGAKAELLDRRLRVNLSVFQDNHHDLQLPVIDFSSTSLGSVVRNAADTQFRGFEAEVNAVPTDWLTLRGTFGYLHAQYKNFVDAGVDVSKNRSFTYAPKYSWSVTSDLRLAEGSWGALHLLTDYRHAGNMFNSTLSLSNTVNTGTFANGALIEGYDKIDARLILSDFSLGDQKAELTLWVRNLTDKRERTSGTPLGASLGNLVLSSYGADPRTFGAAIKLNF